MSQYTIEGLKIINQSYDYHHRVKQTDVDKANQWVKLIEGSRKLEAPQVGDILEFTDKYGHFYKNAHIESIGEQLRICEQPYIPFVGKLENGDFYTSTSGGAWSNIPTRLQYLGKRRKLFRDWGHCGACGNGAFNFYAEVNVWTYTELPNN